jgi:hypothetical protein
MGIFDVKKEFCTKSYTISFFNFIL